MVAAIRTIYLTQGGLRPDFHQPSFTMISICVAQSLIQIMQSWENFYSGRCGDNDLLLTHWTPKIPVNHKVVKDLSPSLQWLSPRLWGCWYYSQSVPVPQPLITKPWNHRILNVGKEHWNHPATINSVLWSPPPLNHVLKCHSHMCFEQLQGQWLYHCPGKPIPMPEHSFNEVFFVYIPPKPSQHHFLLSF